MLDGHRYNNAAIVGSGQVFALSFTSAPLSDIQTSLALCLARTLHCGSGAYNDLHFYFPFSPNESLCRAFAKVTEAEI